MKKKVLSIILFLILLGCDSPEKRFNNNIPNQLFLRFDGSKEKFYKKPSVEILVNNQDTINFIWKELRKVKYKFLSSSRPVIWSIKISPNQLENKNKKEFELIYIGNGNFRFEFDMEFYTNDSLASYLKSMIGVSAIEELPMVDSAIVLKRVIN